MNKIKEFFYKVKKKFWAVVTIIFLIILVIMTGGLIFVFILKDKTKNIFSRRIKENEEIIKNGNNTTSDNDNYIDSMRKKYN